MALGQSPLPARPWLWFFYTGITPQLAITPVRCFSSAPTNTSHTARNRGAERGGGRGEKGAEKQGPAFASGPPWDWASEGGSGGDPAKAGAVEKDGEGHGEGRGKGRRCSLYASRARRPGGGAERQRWGLQQPLHSSSQPQHHHPSPGRGAG